MNSINHPESQLAMAQAALQMHSPEDREILESRERLRALQACATELDIELATLRMELGSFERRYVEIVGRRYAELDAIEAEIAELIARRDPENRNLADRARAARKQERVSREATERTHTAPVRPPPDPDVKRLFREVAKRIHPDLATGEADRARREQLMRAANLAYEAGDAARLQEILREYETDPTRIGKDAAVGERVRLRRAIAEVEQRIAENERALVELRGGDLFRLWTDAAEAAAGNRDLLAEMAAAVAIQIESARDRLASAKAQR
jgi:hypothetical protein